MSHSIFSLALLLLCAFGRSQSFAQVISPFQSESLTTLQSWKDVLKKQVEIDEHSFLAKYFGQAVALDLKQSKESRLTPDQKKIVKAFSDEGSGWLTCVTTCVVHVRQNNLEKASATIDHIISQDKKDQDAYQAGLKAQAERFRQDQINQAIALSQANARQAAEAKAQQDLIDSNKNARVQLPAIIADWHMNAYATFDTDTIRTVAANDGTLVVQTCRDDSYWLSGRQLCIVISQKTLYYNERLNGFCDTQTPLNCNYVFQVSNDDARKLVIIGQPFSKLTTSESQKIFRAYARIDKEFQNSKFYPVIPNALVTMESQTSSLLGAWNESSKGNSSDGLDSNILFISKDSPGLLRILNCDLQVWRATNGNRCQDKDERQARYYYNPEFAGFCKLGDRCSRGFKFANGHLDLVSDPLGIKNYSNRGQVVATFDHPR